MKHDGIHEDEEFEHESYGLIQFSRISGGKTHLFGSSIRNHLSTIIMRVGKGKLVHGLSEDRFYGSIRGEYIEVQMSAAQFAELLTTMNMGSGVPCTIRYFNGKKIEDPPDLELEVERVRDGFKVKAEKLVEEMEETARKIDAILKKKSITKKDKETISWAFGRVIQEVRANMPFVLKQFQEATDRLVTAGKAEIDSFVTNMVQKTGLKELQRMSDTPLMLEGETAEDDDA